VSRRGEFTEEWAERWHRRNGKELEPAPAVTATYRGVPLDVLRLANEAEYTASVVTEKSTEEVLAEAIDAKLRLEGFIVLVADNGGHKLNTVGFPDRMVGRPGRNLWVALEYKRPKGGVVRRAQAALVAVGASVVVRSVEEAVEEVVRGLGAGD